MVLWFDAGRHPGCTAPVTRLKTRGKASRSDATHPTLCALRRWTVSLGDLPKFPRTCTERGRPTGLAGNILSVLFDTSIISIRLVSCTDANAFPKACQRLDLFELAVVTTV